MYTVNVCNFTLNKRMWYIVAYCTGFEPHSAILQFLYLLPSHYMWHITVLFCTWTVFILNFFFFITKIYGTKDEKLSIHTRTINMYNANREKKKTTHNYFPSQQDLIRRQKWSTHKQTIEAIQSYVIFWWISIGFHVFPTFKTVRCASEFHQIPFQTICFNTFQSIRWHSIGCWIVKQLDLIAFLST